MSGPIGWGEKRDQSVLHTNATPNCRTAPKELVSEALHEDSVLLDGRLPGALLSKRGNRYRGQQRESAGKTPEADCPDKNQAECDEK